MAGYNRDPMAIEVWYNTGFDKHNIPDNPTLLGKLPNPRIISSHWLYQASDLSQIKVACTYDEIRDGDYLRINYHDGNKNKRYVYYFITGLEMETENCALLYLECDYWTTGNCLNFAETISGWTTRAHVAKNQDVLFSNMLSEDFQPQTDLVLDGIKTYATSTDGVSIVGSTVDISDTKLIAEEYIEANGHNVSVPKVKSIPRETECIMTLPFYGEKTTELPTTCLYEFTMGDSEEEKKLRLGLESVRGLGLDNAITCSYRLPTDWYEQLVVDRRDMSIIRLEGVNKQEDTGLPFKFKGNIRNAKVYSLYNDYNIASICSGDKITTAAHLIRQDNASPILELYSDPSPDGRPYCQFQYQDGNLQPAFANAVEGMNWLNAPYVVRRTSGSFIAQNRFERNMQTENENHQYNAVMDVANAFSSWNPFTIAGNLLSSSVNTGNRAIQMANQRNDFNESQRIVTPNISFPQSITTQSYMGNGFLVYRTRLSDTDVMRADNYFDHYGYAQSKPFSIDDLKNRPKFNYIMCRDVTFRMNPIDIDNHLVSTRILQGAAQQLMNGVRLWHVRPDPNAYTTNF